MVTVTQIKARSGFLNTNFNIKFDIRWLADNRILPESAVFVEVGLLALLDNLLGERLTTLDSCLIGELHGESLDEL